MLKALDIETKVVVQVVQQVDAGKVTGRVIEVHVFAAWVTAVDSAGVWCRVPRVYHRIELHARVGAAPRCFGKLAEYVPSLDRTYRFTSTHSFQIPIAVSFNCLHKLVGYPHRVVCVLVLYRVNVFTV